MKPDLFTQRVQLTWIFILGLMFVGIGQRFSFRVYQIAIVIMILAGLSQIAIGNVPPTSSRKHFFKFLAVFGAVIIVIFGFSIWIVPYLVQLGR